MAVIINGTTGLSGVSTVNLANGSVTQNILANNVAGTVPLFSAYSNATQSLSGNANTKVLFAVEETDTANWYDTSTSRYTPQIAGWYMFTAWLYLSAGANVQTMIYKNGSQASGKIVGYMISGASCGGSAIVYMNGSTDYAEIYGFVNTTVNAVAGSYITYFQGQLLRAA
jgi:hypothetical protein